MFFTMSAQPQTLHVSGMPLWRRGWNGAYTRNEGTPQDRWDRVATSYYGIPIDPTTIIWDGSSWCLRTNKGKNHRVPLVTLSEDIETWWNSNNGLVIFFLLVSLWARLFVFYSIGLVKSEK